MASTQATIDLIVRGSGAVNRLIDDISRLDGVIQKLNSKPLDISAKDLTEKANKVSNTYLGLQGKIADRTKDVLKYEERIASLRDKKLKTEQIASTFQDKQDASYRRLVSTIKKVDKEIELLNQNSKKAKESIRSAVGGTRKIVPELIDANEARRSVESLKSLANAYNKYGDSLRSTAQETTLAKSLTDDIAQLRSYQREIDATSARIQTLYQGLSKGGKSGSSEQMVSALFDIQEQEQALEKLQKEYDKYSGKILKTQDLLFSSLGARKDVTGKATSLNKIQAEAEALALFANNATIASSEFNRFTVATEAAAGKLARSQQSTFRALAFGLSGEGAAPAGLGRPDQMAGAGRMAREAIADIPSLVRSEASFNAHINYLEKIKSLVPFAGSLYRELENAIAGMSRELSNVQLKGQVSSIMPAAGPVSLLPQFSVESADKQARFRERQVADAWKMRGGPALPAGFTERGRISKEFGALGTGFLPVSGKMPGGQGAVPGSPQAKKQEADLQKKINSSLIQQEELQGRIDRANLTDFQRQELTNRLLSARDAILKGNFDTSRAISGQVDLTRYSYERYNRDLAKSNKLTSDLEKYTQKTFDFANKLEGTSPAVFDSSDLDAFVNRFSEIEGIYKDLNKESREAGKDFDRRLNATGPFKDRLVELQTLSADLTLNSRKGVQVDQERAKVASLIQKLESGSVQVNQQNLKLVSDMTTSLQKRLALRIREAKVAGTYDTGRGVGGGKIATPERLEDAVRKLLGKAISVEKQAISVQGKGVASADELRLQVQEKINELKRIEGKITSDNAESMARDIGVLQRGIIDISNALGQARNQIVETAKLTGFDKSFETFQGSLQQSRTFFENVSPSEAIDKIVREFNQGVLAGPESGGGAATANNIIDTFSSSMKAGGGKVVSAASSVFNKVTQAINFAFGIASPSRFMIELVQNLANTYVLQLQKEYPRIKSATEKAFGQLEPRRPVKELTATFRGFETVDRPPTGFRPLANRAFDPSGAGGEMDEMFRRFRNQIAQLTTQPEIYRNILNALPSSSLTTDLAAAASRRAAASELPSFMPIQRQLGPGELEKAIQSQFAEYLKGIKIPNPWIGPIGDYRNFIAAVAGETNKLSSLRRESQLALPAGRERLALPPGADFQAVAEDRIAKALERSAQRGAAVFAEDLERSTQRVFGGAGGGVPPSPPIPPGGAPDDFNDRFAAASQQGVQGLLGLAELRDPSKIATARLEILSKVLQEVYSQLNPVAPGAKQLNKELRETVGKLNNIQASRAIDADPLVRLTKNPRLAAGISEGMIGGAFPLLFGQGMGAAAFGGAGGFFGGMAGGALGFGLSLVGTAVGSAIDAFINNLKELASSLKEPTAALEAMKTAGLRVDTELEDVVKRLEGTGYAAAAQALVLADLEKQLGVDGVRGIKALEAQQKELESQWQEMTATLTGFLIPALVGATSFFSDVSAGIAGLSSLRLPDWLQKGIEVAANAAVPAGTLTGRLFRAASERGRSEMEGAGATDPRLTEDLRRKDELAAARGPLDLESFRLESFDVAKRFTDQVKASQREQQDLDRQRYELLESYEKSIADIRLGIERRVEQERLANLAKQNDLLAAQGDLAAQRLRNANAELKSSLTGNEFGQQLADIVAEFTEKQLSTENEIANRRRSLEAEIEGKRVEVEQYKFDVAKQVSDLNMATERQVASIRLGVIRKNEDYDRGRFELEKRIAIFNLEIKKIENRQAVEGIRARIPEVAAVNPAQALLLQQFIDRYRDIDTLADSAMQKIAAVQAPSRVSFAGIPTGASASTAGFEAMASRGVQLRRSIESVRDEISALAKNNDFIGLNSKLKALADQGAQAAQEKFEDLVAELSGRPLQESFDEIDEAISRIVSDQNIAPYAELVVLYGTLSKENLKLAQSLEFFNERAGQQVSQLDSLRVEINSAISGSTELERTMMDLTQRGIKPASEEFKILTENAKRIDALQQKLQIINNFKTASSELTLSLRGLIENFYELGNASEAVKRVGEELGRKSLGFVLDIAFKPVEKAMQDTMFGLAEKLGFEIRPEALQQLEEIKATKFIITDILKEVTKLSGALPGAIAPADLFGSASLSGAVATSGKVGFITSVGTPGYFDVGVNGAPVQGLDPQEIKNLFVGAGESISAYQKRLDNFFGSLVNSGNLLESDRADFFGALNSFTERLRKNAAGAGNQIVPGPGSSPQDLPYSQRITPGTIPGAPSAPILPERRYRVGDRIPAQSSLPGGSFDISRLAKDYGSVASAREAFSMPEDGTVEIVPVDPYTGVQKEIEGAGGAFGELKEGLKAVPPVVAPVIEGTKEMVQTSVDSSDKITETLQENGQKLSGVIVPQWTKSLGQVVTGLSLASSAVIGIVGGVQNIRKGGAGNVLTGIGSILTTIGGIGMSAAGFMKPGIPGDPTAAGGNVAAGIGRALGNANGNIFEDGELMKFANGGILQSPTLFSFEDAGVTRTGQAGEAGAEAIMPLKRAKDGRLGVEADLSVPFEASDALETGLNDADSNPRAADLSAPSASGRGNAGAGSLSVPFQKTQGRMSAAQMMQIAAESGLSVPFAKGETAASSAVVEGDDGVIRFESVIINNQEFVTRKEAEEIGRKAEARGASRGAQLAQKGIKNNPRVRASLGIK
jgi:hypothetical protein